MDEHYWNSVGKQYEREIFSVLKEDLQGVVCRQMKPRDSHKKIAADFGCGTGNFLGILSTEFLSVTAFDLSQTCLNKARARFRRNSNIVFQQLDLTQKDVLKNWRPVDFGLCVNAIMMSSYKERQIFLANLSTGIRKGGRLLLVVPSLESFFYVVFRLHQWNLEEGFENEVSLSALEDGLPLRKRHILAGLVRLDGVATKHYLADELRVLLGDAGFFVKKMDKVEYRWQTECKNPCRQLKDPYPWDWMVLAERI